MSESMPDEVSEWIDSLMLKIKMRESRIENLLGFVKYIKASHKCICEKGIQFEDIECSYCKAIECLEWTESNCE